MITFIKKHRLSLSILVIIVLGVVNLYLYKDSAKLSEINSRLEVENQQLNLDIKKSQVKEDKYRLEIRDKNQTIHQLDLQLEQSVLLQKELKEKVATLCNPQDPQTFKKLSECREKYSELVKDFELSLAAGRETEMSLKLCLDKTENQEEVIDLQEKAYYECREQGNLKDMKLQKSQDAIEKLDRYYKRKLLQRNTSKYTVGIIAGIIVGYFLFKKN